MQARCRRLCCSKVLAPTLATRGRMPARGGETESVRSGISPKKIVLDCRRNSLRSECHSIFLRLPMQLNFYQQDGGEGIPPNSLHPDTTDEAAPSAAAATAPAFKLLFLKLILFLLLLLLYLLLNLLLLLFQ